jgi:hypothetical protein
MLSEMSTSQKDKHYLFSLMCRTWTESSSPSYGMNVEGRLLDGTAGGWRKERVMRKYRIEGHYLYKSSIMNQAPVAHACNPSYTGGLSFKASWGK